MRFFLSLSLISSLLTTGCTVFPSKAGKEHSWETERNWQVLNALNAASTLSNQDCIDSKVPTFAGIVVGPDAGKSEVVGYFAFNAFIHYTITKLLYYNAPDRMWRAWNFSTQGMATWDIAAQLKNC